MQPVFATGAGAFLGIDRPTVAMGQAVYPVLTSRPAVGGPHTGSTDAPDTTGAFNADLLPPKRIQAELHLPPDGCHAVQFGHGFSAPAWRSTAGSKKSSTLDAIAGADGLLTGTNLGNHNVTAVTTFALYLSQFLFSASDGRYAGMKSDIRVLMGSPTYGHAGGVYQSSAYKSALSALEQESGGVRVSAHVPAVASHRQNAVVTARDASGHGATGLGRGHDHRGRSDPER